MVELGAGDGANFALYPETVREVIAIEPEPRFREQAEEAARAAAVAVRVRPGIAEELPLEDRSVDASSPRSSSAPFPIPPARSTRPAG